MAVALINGRVLIDDRFAHGEAVVLDGGRIAAIVPQADLPAAMPRRDLGGAMLLPAIAPALAAMNARRLRNAASAVTSDARTSEGRTCLISIGDFLPRPAPSPP